MAEIVASIDLDDAAYQAAARGVAAGNQTIAQSIGRTGGGDRQGRRGGIFGPTGSSQENEMIAIVAQSAGHA